MHKEQGVVTTDPSDTAISVNGSDLYRLGRHGFDNITKYSVNFGFVPSRQWQYSVSSDASAASANPYAVVFESETRAFVVQYGLPVLWVIDPSIESSGESGFKLGEIDFSDYADYAESGGTPGLTDALVHDNKLFVLMERLNADYSATENSYLAVIDLESLTEIDTDPGMSGLDGIDLGIKNAANIDLHNGMLYIAGRGNTGMGATGGIYNGGIVTVNASTYDVELLVDDGDATTHPYGQFQRVEVVNDNHAYFIGRAGWGDDTLYHFNPTATNPNPTAVSGVEHLSIADIEHETLSDPAALYTDLLYVAVQSATTDSETRGRIEVVNVLDQSVIGTLELISNPMDLEAMDK